MVIRQRIFQTRTISAFLVGLTFAIAASANFPALLMSISWRKFSTQGAVASILTGAFLSLTMILLSDTVWVQIFHNAKAIVPIKNPCVISMTAAFVVGIVVSLASPDPIAQKKFEDEKIRTYLGVGAE